MSVDKPAPAQPRVPLRHIAFYLPQFYPIPENDQWWGKGFTEWTNATRAQPLFRGHYQPHLPADLGFYDLRLGEARAAQAELASSYGIEAFCYYHYWFEGRKLLQLPFEEVLGSGEPNLKFCLCWANHNWTREWDAGASQVLVRQGYSDADDLAHLQWLASAFADPRYLRVDGKPLFLVYRASDLPDPARTTDRWRAEASRLGIGELYLCRVEAYPEDRGDPTVLGFDAGVQFQPDSLRLGRRVRPSAPGRIARRLLRPHSPYRNHAIYEYQEMVELALNQDDPAYKRFPCVAPSYDNSPRKKYGAFIMRGSTPALYQRWLRAVVERFEPYSPEENLLFVNAWNEWAEGNHLEPCQRWGHGYLSAHRIAS